MKSLLAAPGNSRSVTCATLNGLLGLSPHWLHTHATMAAKTPSPRRVNLRNQSQALCMMTCSKQARLTLGKILAFLQHSLNTYFKMNTSMKQLLVHVPTSWIYYIIIQLLMYCYMKILYIMCYLTSSGYLPSMPLTIKVTEIFQVNHKEN